MDQNTIELLSENNKLIYLRKLEQRAYHKLVKHHCKPIWFYNRKMINDILTNEKTHYVETFKEYLLYEDYNEFIRQYYGKTLIEIKLRKILNFYDKFSKIYPNYTVLRESKYLYKNIKRKQKVINQINENKNKEKENLINADISNTNSKNTSLYNKTIFDSKVINLIYTGHNTPTINRNKEIINNINDDNESIYEFINRISFYEKKGKNKIGKHNIKKNEKSDFSLNNIKKEKANNFKKISKLLFNTSNINSNNNMNNSNSILKNKIKFEFKKNNVENYSNINNSIKNNKIVLYPYNYIAKQKPNLSLMYQKQKLINSIKYSNLYKKREKNNNSNSIRELKKNKSHIERKSYLKYNNNIEKYRKILLSTSSANTPKVMTERIFSSPKKNTKIQFFKKKSKSQTKRIQEQKNKNKNNIKINLTKRNISLYNKSNAFNKKTISQRKNNISNIFKNERISIQYHKRKMINNFNPNSIKKYYNNNVSLLKTKNRTTRKSNIYNSKSGNNKIINNYNIMNGIMNNSTQINIYNGKDLIKSLSLYWNSFIKSSSSFYNSKSNSKKKKKLNNIKNFIQKHIKDKMNKEPFIEKSGSNEKLLKFLDIYCQGGKKRKTNIKKNFFNANKNDKSLNYKSKSKSKSKWEDKSLSFFNQKYNKRIMKKNS